MQQETTLQLSISYKIERMPSQMEECHGYHEMGGYQQIEIQSVFIETEDGAIDIKKHLPLSVLDRIANTIETD
jgi:hypothetical protein